MFWLTDSLSLKVEEWERISAEPNESFKLIIDNEGG